jgi:hypothetical protein
MKGVWIYVDTSKDVGDKDHLKVFANEAAAGAWLNARKRGVWVAAFAGTTERQSHLLERHIDLAALLEPIRHRQVLGAHEFRIEQF